MIECVERIFGRGMGRSIAPVLILIIGLVAARPASAQDGPMAPVQPVQAQAQKPQSQSGGTAQSPATDPAGSPSGAAAVPAPANRVAGADSANPLAGPAPAVAKIVVPSGTHIPLVLHNAVSTRSARPGDPVYFETSFPVMIDGKVVIPAGSYISGEITESKRPGRVKGRGELMMKLTTLILPNAYMVNLNAVPGNAGTGGNETTDSEGKIVADSNKGGDIGTIAKTTGAGAGIGGLATQSAKGVGIGAGVGAAVGLAAVLLTRGPEAELPRGSTVEAVIDRSILLDADKVQFTGPGQASALAGPPNREPVRSSSPF
jgi:type IV secretion system protein VirB10